MYVVRASEFADAYDDDVFIIGFIAIDVYIFYCYCML
jgi:hypothetical protein